MDEAFAHNSESKMMDLVEDIQTKMISNDLNIRPKNFKDVIGQDDVKEYLRIKISAFQKNNISIGHLLFLGFSGAGKTNMANVMAIEVKEG